MPEVPDIAVFAIHLKTQFGGKTISKINVVNANKLKDSPARLSESLEGRVLEDIYRSGKEFRLIFSSGITLGMHLMLTGDVYTFQEKNEQKFTIIEFHFQDGSGIALTDRMRNAHVKLDPIDKDGVDVLEVDYTYMKGVLKGKAKIKDIMLDQNIIRGIGNGYSDEILWESRISPFSAGSAIPDEKIKELAKNIREVILSATGQILKAYPDLITGEIKEFLKIHRQKVSPTGWPIKIEKKGARKTYFTDEQVLYT